MKLLDHLNDADFVKELDFFYGKLEGALEEVLDDWIKREIIKPENKSKVMKEWKYTKGDLLDAVL